MSCRCVPDRGYCDFCLGEVAQGQRDRLMEAAKRACALIYKYVPDSPLREKTLYDLGDSEAVGRQVDKELGRYGGKRWKG